MPPQSTRLAPDLPQQLCQQANTGLAWLDTQARFAWLNPAWLEILSLPRRRLMGELLETLDPGLPALGEALQRAKAGGTTVQLRRVHLAPALGREVDADLALTASPAGGVLLELHELAPEIEQAAPRLSESL